MHAQRLIVRPGRPLSGAFRPPGDKSITHRAYLIGLLHPGPLEIRNPNLGEDCRATLRSARVLGARFENGVLTGAGMKLAEPEGILDCGNSGTTLRLLSGILAAQPFLSVLAGDRSLHRRPVERIVEPLRLMGAQVLARGGDRLPPLVLRGGELRAIGYVAPMASAQVASCVLLAGLFAAGRTTVELPGPARDHTERMLGSFGVPIEVHPLAGGGRRTTLTGPGRVTAPAGALAIPGDFSAAAFFLAAAAATPGARVRAEGVGLNPTRSALLEVLEHMGAGVERAHVRIEGGEDVGDVTVTGPETLNGFDIPPHWMPRMIDEVPAWAIAAAAARGRSRLAGARELKFKESDRLAALAANLARVGIEAHEGADGLEIIGGTARGGEVAALDDHRIAMAFATLGTFARGPVVVDDASTIATSYPGFLETLRGLGAEAEVAEETPRERARRETSGG